MRPFLLAVALLAFSPGSAFADPELEAERKRIQTALNSLYQAQQSVYQQFQMVQELRRAELARADSLGLPAYGVAPAPVDYEALQRERQQREERLKSLTDELNKLYGIYREFEAEKRPLLERLSELTRAR